LARIGIDKFAAAASGSPRELANSPGQLRSTMTADFGQLALAQAGGTDEFPPVDVVLDVRTNNEWQKSHVAGAVHVPLYERKNRLGALRQRIPCHRRSLPARERRAHSRDRERSVR